MANKKNYLGEFEHIVLLTILALEDNAYGVTIRQKLKDSIDRDVAIGALYITADRLEKKGLLTSTKSGSTHERGGKAKRFFKVTNLGKTELNKTKQDLSTLWSQVSLQSDQTQR